MYQPVVGINFYRLCSKPDCGVKFVLAIKSKSKAEMDHHGERISFQCSPVFFFCFLEPSQRCQEIKSIADANQRRNRIDCHCRLKMMLRGFPVIVDSARDHSQHTVRFTQCLVDCECL